MMWFVRAFGRLLVALDNRSDRPVRRGLEKLFSDPDVEATGRLRRRLSSGLAALALTPAALSALALLLTLERGQRTQNDALDRGREVAVDAADGIHGSG
jgi:hypothetical protein